MMFVYFSHTKLSRDHKIHNLRNIHEKTRLSNAFVTCELDDFGVLWHKIGNDFC